MLIFTEFPGEVLGDKALLLENVDDIRIDIPVHLRYLLNAFGRVMDDFTRAFFIKASGACICVVVVFFKLFRTHGNQIVTQRVIGVLSTRF